MPIRIYKSEEKVRLAGALDRCSPILSSGDFLVHQCSHIICALVDSCVHTEVRLGTTTSLHFSVHMNLPEILVIVFR